jgi:hypothetical protein
MAASAARSLSTLTPTPSTFTRSIFVSFGNSPQFGRKPGVLQDTTQIREFTD